ERGAGACARLSRGANGRDGAGSAACGGQAMSFSRRLRNIALSQIQAIQDRLNRIDAEQAEEAEQRRYRREAQEEMNDPTDIRLPMRTPEEIASGRTR